MPEPGCLHADCVGLEFSVQSPGGHMRMELKRPRNTFILAIHCLTILLTIELLIVIYD